MATTGWAVIHCRSPEPAEETLDRLGYVVYLPRYKTRLAGVRIDAIGRRIRTRGPGSIVERVLWPQYLLVLWHDGLRERPINVAGGYLLRYAPDATGRAWPKLVPSEQVDELRRRVDRGDYDQTGPKRWVSMADGLRELLEAAD
jgi:hypothetical protein